LVDLAEYNPWYVDEKTLKKRYVNEYGRQVKNLAWNERRGEGGFLERKNPENGL
jgi:hypothetical protein